MTLHSLPVAIIGGGPVGLAAAAQLVKRGKPFLLFEAASRLGANFLEYGHVRLFSPWRYNMDKAAASLLEKHGAALPDPDHLPLGRDIAAQYLQPLGELPEIKPFVHLGSRVIHVAREGMDKVRTEGRNDRAFEVIVKTGTGAIRKFRARAVLDATGTWQHPNPLVSGGMPDSPDKAIHYGIPDVLGRDRHIYENKRIAVVGSGHSAFNSLLDLVLLQNEAPNTEITWIIRRSNADSLLGGGRADQLPARGALGLRVQQALEQGRMKLITSVLIQSYRAEKDGGVTLQAAQDGTPAVFGPFDAVIANTGARPDFGFLKEIRFAFDPALESVPALAPLIDPNVHSCGTVRPHGELELQQPEKDFYILGAKSYGRAPTFLMATGYEQARSVVAYLAGDLDAARNVELSLPETGVCSSSITIPPKAAIGAGGSCCG
ncbi:NAD(P)-binding domain-containing protein [Planococcus salinus]|uniref:Flavoprotein n=1 Tax=Planococcus salinus TaxID=1848460 RepID=A0A3M8PE35_9BACL|nr:NAD(P)-binding domain-containing protein [Planococcus salinus]RNF41134.1 flavoprotein [Planococcus salinus]